ncbi:MAG: 30S ribosomal protein S6 [Pseudomonadota bacterium]|nr:30S ribosomal protein S6 [Pseudomonadota bacterium]MEC7246165.1 30S ribosomal protein S6 [Pseudomonadota bacterium]
MRLYESVFIARQDVSAQHVEALTKDFSAIIENGGGKIHKHEYWGLRALAYRVKKNRKGHYVMLNLEADNNTLREFERIMGLNEDILRFMNISIEEVEEGPSIMMQAQRAERAPRGGERGDRESRDDARAENNDADASAQTEE